MKRAVLVIDVQNEYFSGKLPVTYPSNSLANILNVMGGAQAHNIPVVIIQHTGPASGATFRQGSPEWELHEAVAQRPRATLIEKSLPGSFSKTGLDTWLKQNGIDTLVITGYMTQMCCDTTARQALDLGYKVEFLSDATGTLAINNSAGSISAEELHRAILVTQQMRFSQVLTSEEWLDLIKS